MLVTAETGDDFVKVLDFGVAKVPIDFTGNPDAGQGTAITKAGMVFGTPDYMAIEQALGHDVDGRADLYSLGVIAFELITGRRPFRSNHEFGVIGQQLTTKAPAMQTRAPWIAVPNEVEGLVAQLLQADVARRVKSAQEVIERVTELLANLPSDWPDPAIPTAEQLDRADEAVFSPSEPAPQVQEQDVPSRSWLGTLHARLPEPMNLVPLWVYISVGVIFVLGGFGIVAGFAVVQEDERTMQAELRERDRQFGAPRVSPVVSAAPRAVDSPPVLSASAQQVLATLTEQQRERLTELRESMGMGEHALATLAEAHPSDAWLRVQIARCYLPGGNHLLGNAESKEGQGSAQRALDWVSAGVRLDPALIGDKFVAGVLWYTAQHTDTREATFKLLSTEMLAAGADIIYDLAVTPGVPASVADNARRWLSTSDFRVAASVEANIAAELLTAPSCDALSSTLPRAVQQGDGRTLTFLESLDVATYCVNAGACKACAQEGHELRHARNELATRLRAK